MTSPVLRRRMGRAVGLDLAFGGFILLLMAFGLRRPFVWVLAFVYIDILSPQKISWGLLSVIPLSLVVFLVAFGGWLIADDKRDTRFTFRQLLLLLLLVYCGLTTISADFPEAAAEKWSWVWKALVFALFLPLALRTRLRIEAAALFMILTAGAIIISGALKTVVSGGGYGELRLFVDNNTGLYEGSIISCVAIAIVPLIVWLMRHGTIFRPDWRVTLFGGALIFACLLIPIGTQARTGLICLGLLCVLSLRTVKHRFRYLALMGAAGLMSVPFLPQSFTARMGTIGNHAADQSASTRVAVWQWTWKYVHEHPLGGGFDAYRGNIIRYNARDAQTSGNTTTVLSQAVEDRGRAYHSSYFEMLGEQGWPGMILWLWLQGLGLWQMGALRRRWTGRSGPGEQWQAPLANALQLAQLVYLTGSLFVGIAYQPFILMLIGLQCGLWSYLKRIDAPRTAAMPLPRRLQPAGLPGLPSR